MLLFKDSDSLLKHLGMYTTNGVLYFEKSINNWLQLADVENDVFEFEYKDKIAVIKLKQVDDKYQYILMSIKSASFIY